MHLGEVESRISRVSHRNEITVSSEEVKTLKRRAEAFLKYAEQAFRDEEFDFVCFASEQAAQLFLKSVTLEIVGEIPRVRRVREILGLLASSLPDVGEIISSFVGNNRERLRALDDAYITARYLPSEYHREDANELLETSKQIFRLGREILEKCRR